MIRLQKLFIRKMGQFSQIAARRPELDFDRLLNPENLASIRENIRCRKQVGDIDQLHRLWNNMQTVIQDKNPTMTMNELTSMWDRFYEEALLIPNDTHPEAPVGDESVAKIIHTNGSKPIFTFKPLFGEDIAVKFKILWQDVGFCCGEKAYFLYNQLAILELALIRFCRDRLRSSGFEEVVVPDVIPKRIVENCGLMNRTDKEIVYSIHGLPNWTLSGTAEMGLASFIENRIFDVNEMPKKFFSVSRCFRPEVATGKLSKGLYRVHEFTKVEMFICTANETGLESNISHLEILEMQKLLFSELNLHFKVLEMPTEELGASAFRKFDIESWFPGRDCYGEIKKN
ncbi:Serine--tRNA ligase, mitochondrial [Trichinella spiralis]|uniref:serine--tRNA ligase n=1 Tax=Trichinella spiralis TaxID=6334 RepID=A0A0V1BUK7_TRISP|nr:Serine--tRNA ligase, mitochondrial [Trichinella spiralis]